MNREKHEKAVEHYNNDLKATKERMKIVKANHKTKKEMMNNIVDDYYRKKLISKVFGNIRVKSLDRNIFINVNINKLEIKENLKIFPNKKNEIDIQCMEKYC